MRELPFAFPSAALNLLQSTQSSIQFGSKVYAAALTRPRHLITYQSIELLTPRTSVADDAKQNDRNPGVCAMMRADMYCTRHSEVNIENRIEVTRSIFVYDCIF
jgi:hypothetical protein